MTKLLFAALLLAVAHCSAATPNLVIINIDDLGYGDIAPFGSATPTPHLTRMAAEGRKLTSHYAAPLCSPSRASLMTGCYPKRVLQIPGVLFPEAAVGLNPEEQNLAKVLRGAGYATGCFGKWHLGDQQAFLPLQQGFDTYFGTPYSNDMGLTQEGAHSSFGEPLPPPEKKRGPQDVPTNEFGDTGRQPTLPLLDGNSVAQKVGALEQESLTRLCTEHAVEFIRAHEHAPFFLYLATPDIHFPYYPGSNFRGKSSTLLTDCVQEADWAVGQILETLTELKLAENTLVIFTSDNGGSVPNGSVNRPLRGTKAQTLEGGIRTPTIAWWPGHVPAGTTTGAITSMMDILPTYAALAGAKLSSAKIDGLDILPVLLGDATAPRDHFFYFMGPTLEAVRQGPWKLNVKSGQLYNLDEDLGEAHDVAAGHPDEVKTLRALAETMRGDLGMEGYGPGCRAMGRVKDPQPLIR